MKITILPSEKQLYCLSLFIEGEPWREVHTTIFGKKPSFSGTTLQEHEAKFLELELKGTKRFVLKRLSLRSYYSGQLKEALHERLVSDNAIEVILQEFMQLGYLNDEEWVENTVRALQRQKSGPKSIALKLRAKGVSENLARLAIEACCDNESQNANIRKLLGTRYRSRNLMDHKDKQKVILALMRKGYAFNQIFSVLQEIIRT